MSLELDLTFRRGDLHLEVGCTIGDRVTALLGRSGAGKTTLLHLVAGLLRPDRGRIVLGGRVLVDRERGTWLPPHRRDIGMVFQDARLLPHYSVRGNLAYGRRRARRGDALELDDVVELLELGPLLDRRPHRLSGGEVQRVALGRALLSGPRLLLLDEPLTGLDHGLKRQVLPFLLRVRDRLDVPVLYVSHHLDELLQVTGQLMTLEAGRLTGQGRHVDLAMDPRVTAGLLEQGLTNVISLTARDGAFVIDTADATGQPLRIPGPCDAGAAALVSIRPEDVALAADMVAATSIRNQLRCRVARCARHRDGVLVELDVGQPLLVHVTEEAANELQLRPGLELRCLIKTTAIRRLT